MSGIRGITADAGMQLLVITAVKNFGGASLRVGQVGVNGVLAEFACYCFQAGPAALNLRVIVAVAAPALRATGAVVVEQWAAGVGAGP